MLIKMNLSNKIGTDVGPLFAETNKTTTKPA